MGNVIERLLLDTHHGCHTTRLRLLLSSQTAVLGVMLLILHGEIGEREREIATHRENLLDLGETRVHDV